MSNDPLLTIDELATVLRVPVEMAKEWEEQAILPIEEDATGDDATGDDSDEGADANRKKYRQRNVVLALREYPDVMTAIKRAMMAKRGISSEPAKGTGM